MSLNLPVKVKRNGEDIGVFPIQEIAPRLNCWFFEPTDLYWHEGMPDWEPLSQFEDTIVRNYLKQADQLRSLELEHAKFTQELAYIEQVNRELQVRVQAVRQEIEVIEAKIAAKKAGK